mmetsp:Transcript_55278/g.63208  ORF Transcript_55278/g.63208 Transcript_55278/m.63208 type:complete len:341 (+) Transcript_55278:122-1144(+)
MRAGKTSHRKSGQDRDQTRGSPNKSILSARRQSHGAKRETNKEDRIRRSESFDEAILRAEQSADDETHREMSILNESQELELVAQNYDLLLQDSHRDITEIKEHPNNEVEDHSDLLGPHRGGKPGGGTRAQREERLPRGQKFKESAFVNDVSEMVSLMMQAQEAKKEVLKNTHVGRNALIGELKKIRTMVTLAKKENARLRQELSAVHQDKKQIESVNSTVITSMHDERLEYTKLIQAERDKYSAQINNLKFKLANLQVEKNDMEKKFTEMQNNYIRDLASLEETINEIKAEGIDENLFEDFEDVTQGYYLRANNQQEDLNNSPLYRSEPDGDVDDLPRT